MKKGVRIMASIGMVDIDSEDISYGNIRRMYTSGNGSGLQITERLKESAEDIDILCGEIAEKIYALQDLVKER